MRTFVRLYAFLLWTAGSAIAAHGAVALPAPSGLAAHQILQRDGRGFAQARVRGAAPTAWVGVVSARVSGQPSTGSGWQAEATHRFSGGSWDCTLREIPTGGPYAVTIELRDQGGSLLGSTEVADIMVGDIWVLAGQSNMEGMGDLVDVENPSPSVHSFTLADRWEIATEPLHRRVESENPVYRPGVPSFASGAERAAYIERYNTDRKNGSGLGLRFAKEIVAATGIPIGLIPCAMGGTPISSWEGSRSKPGGAKLYAAMLRQIEGAGGSVRGVLWYQGESDARVPEKAALYEANLATLISSLRADLRQPDLAFYMVQIGRMLEWVYFGANSLAPPPNMDRQFSEVREAQRKIAAHTAHVGMIPALDLPLRDSIHLSTPSLKRAACRLANLVLNREYARGECPSGPRLKSIRHDVGSHEIRVQFSDVTGGFTVLGPPAGFTLWRPGGGEIRAIFDTTIDRTARDTVVLSYQGALPPAVQIAYGWGVNPFCNLADNADMAPVGFGPVALRPESGGATAESAGEVIEIPRAGRRVATSVVFEKYPPLPLPARRRVQLGVAGAFVGVSARALLVAGGSNFPFTPFADGGKRSFADDIYVLEKQVDGGVRWLVDPGLKLPQPLGYGASISIAEGIVCIGGADAAACTAGVLLLKWDSEKRAISWETWPSLPEPAMDLAATITGRQIFAAGGRPAPGGGSTRNFWMLDLARRNQPEKFEWVRVPPWPGPPRSKSILVAQSMDGTNYIYLFSGRTEEPGKPTAFLTDAYRYDPARSEWKQLRPVGSGIDGSTEGRCVMVGTGVNVPTGEIAVFGGYDAALYRASDAYTRRVAVAEGALPSGSNLDRRSDLEAEFADALAARRKFLAEFPGFSRDVLAYEPWADRWRKLGEFPERPPATTAAAYWDGGFVIPTGEITPGVRTDQVWRATFKQ